MLRLFRTNEKGVTAIEYAVIAGAMGLALIVVMPKFGSQIVVGFTSLGSHIASGK